MHTSPKILEKVRHMVNDYYALAYLPVAELPMQYWQTLEHLRRPPSKVPWKRAKNGLSWGGPWMSAWFRTRYRPAPELAGQALFLRANTGGQESLVWVDNEPRAILTGYNVNALDDKRHTELLLTPRAGRRSFKLAIEAYAWHPDIGSGPRHANRSANRHTFRHVDIATRRDDVWGLVFDLRVLLSLHDALEENSLRRNKIVKGLAAVFAVLPQIPVERPEAQWRPAVAKARTLLAPLLAAQNGDTAPLMGLTGHSHMDTAWRWTVAETERKCARTFANALTLMEEYPGYRFIQSSSYHADMMRRLYPRIFKRMQKMTAAGRWEPNGGSWVEPDCNLIGAEALVRQFLVGQTATKTMFGYRSDTFWMPDTFGYSAALPQILQGCDIEFFCTTKLSWNDTNRFPYDSFVWRGLDGSSVLAHFNNTHCWPDPRTLTSMWNRVQHKDVQDRALCSYGYGDGGGGPMRGMIEVADRVKDLEGCPRTERMSVGTFMRGLQQACPDLPVWQGELYLELHRGTLTSIHAIKRGNRKCEVALQIAETLCTRAALEGRAYPAKKLDALWKKLLVNQFHDILPGTSIPEVNDQAIREFAEVRADAEKLIVGATPGRGSAALELHNTLSWDRTGTLMLDVPDRLVPADKTLSWQLVKNIEGRRQLALAGVTVPALGSRVLPVKKSGARRNGKSPFTVKGNRIATPHARVTFDKAGGFRSFLYAGRELVRDPRRLLNSLWLGQDVPKSWDNWDIDEDQAIKMRRETRLVSRKVVADGPLELRVRLHYRLGLHSKLAQDVVFHADTPRVDFETKIDWHEKHALLKAGFDVDVFADRARHEIQFGHAFRNTHTNLGTDRARFESCNHRWSDLAEPDFGVALLNDCKYGISIDGSDLRLSLLKAGTHPDPRADAGTHVFIYALLPHNSPFSATAVVRPGYELNVPVVARPVSAKATGKQSLLTIDNPGVVVEAVKGAEDGNGFVLRLYEAEGNRSTARLRFNMPITVQQTNILEEKPKPVRTSNNTCKLTFRPFEIKTLRCVPSG